MKPFHIVIEEERPGMTFVIIAAVYTHLQTQEHYQEADFSHQNLPPALQCMDFLLDLHLKTWTP